jgi:hypothetical protein
MATMICEHVEEVGDVEPRSDGCQERLQNRLRQLQEQARHETLP